MSAPRLLIGLVAAGLAVAAGLGIVRLLPAGPGALAAGSGVALILLLGWLLAPRPWGGGAGLRRLLVPDPARPAAAAALMTVCWTLGISLLSLVALGTAHGFDLDATGWRPATAAEVARHAGLGLVLSALHGLFCLGWGMGDLPGRDRDSAAVRSATVLGAGFATLAGGLAGAPATTTALGVAVVAMGTLVMAVVVTLGGRVWPVILGNAFAWTVPMLAVEVPTYAY